MGSRVLLRIFVCASWGIAYSAMELLQWDPERYDYISECPIFLATWCLWNWTEFSAVITFSYLDISDISNFCCSTYCIYLDFTAILNERHRYLLFLRALREDGRS